MSESSAAYLADLSSLFRLGGRCSKYPTRLDSAFTQCFAVRCSVLAGKFKQKHGMSSAKILHSIKPCLGRAIFVALIDLLQTPNRKAERPPNR